MRKISNYMKHLALLLGALLTTQAFAQTKVTKNSAVKSNNYGVTYILPQTSLIIDATVTKVTRQAGPYYKYAERLLGIKDAITASEVYYELGKINVINKGIPDPNRSYTIELKNGTFAPFVYLTEDGLLCTINAEYTPEELDSNKKKQSINNETTVENTSVYTEELLMAGSTAKMAEVAAKQIYRIRESRMNILTGEADNLPPDGEAMKLVIKELEQQEQALVNLFAGVTTKEVMHKGFVVNPVEDIAKSIVFRFSSKLGVVPADDLGGMPVYLSLNQLDKQPPLDAKELEKKEKSLKGVVYNAPGKALLTITMGKQTLLKEEVMVTQFGTHESLTPKMFEDKKAPVKVYFYPETGAIKQIIQ